MSSSTTSPVMRDDDDDGGGGGGGFPRRHENDLERLMRSLSEDVNQSSHQNQWHHHHEFQQHHHDSFQQQPLPGFQTFAHSQPSFLLELLSMPAPAAGWNPGLPDVAGMNLGGYNRDAFWDSLPEYPPWLPNAQDSLPELLTSPWNQTENKLNSHSMSPVTRSPSRLNSATSTLPSTPNSSMSSGSFSDAGAAEEDQSHFSGRPALLQQPQPVAGPSGSSSGAKRKTPDGNFDESCDEIQSLDSKKP